MPDKAIKYMMYGFGIYPFRSENIYKIMEYYRLCAKFDIAESFYRMGKMVKFPSNDIMFINMDVYRFLFDNDYFIINYYLVPYKDQEFCIKMVRMMRDNQNNCTNRIFYNLIIANMRYYITSLPVKDRIKIQQTTIKFMDYDMIPSTPCIMEYKYGYEDCYLMLHRYVNYSINLATRCIEYSPTKHQYTVNKITKFDKDFNVKSEIVIEPSINNLRHENLEDVKLFQHGKDIQVVGTVNCCPILESRQIDMFHGLYEINTNEIKYKILLSPKKSWIEKNWVLFEDNDGEVRTIYS